MHLSIAGVKGIFPDSFPEKTGRSLNQSILPSREFPLPTRVFLLESSSLPVGKGHIASVCQYWFEEVFNRPRINFPINCFWVMGGTISKRLDYHNSILKPTRITIKLGVGVYVQRASRKWVARIWIVSLR